jgi:hypothetical protein
MDKHIIKFKETSREQELEFYSNNFLSENRVEFVKIEEAKKLSFNSTNFLFTIC